LADEVIDYSLIFRVNSINVDQTGNKDDKKSSTKTQSDFELS
jgi:hypothetical protein